MKPQQASVGYTDGWEMRKYLPFVPLAVVLTASNYFLLRHFNTLVHLVGVTGTFVVMTISYLNQVMPRNNKQSPPLPHDLPYVAAVIPTYGEPGHVLEKTILALKQLDYPAERLYILVSDDGHSDEVRHLAQVHGVHYNRG